MLNNPEIKTERLILNTITNEDINDIFAYASVPEVAKYTSWLPHKDIEDTRLFLDFINSSTSNLAGKICYIWAIRQQSENKVIGTIGFTQTSLQKGHIDYTISNVYWNNGITTEAATGVLKWCFENITTLEEIESGGLSENIASLGVMRKCGMVFKFKKHLQFAKFNNEVKEVTYYSITKQRFEEHIKK